MKSLLRQLDTLTRQRDDLSMALEGLLKELGQSFYHSRPALQEAVEAARAALTKAGL